MLEFIVQKPPKLSSVQIGLTNGLSLPAQLPARLMQLFQHCTVTVNKLSISATDYLKLQGEAFVLQTLK